MTVTSVVDDALVAALTGKAAPETYLSALIDWSWASLVETRSQTTSSTSVPLQVVGFSHPDTEGIFADSSRRIVVGLRAVAKISQASLELTEHLTRNYVMRSGVLGDIPGPSQFASAEDYPALALHFAAGEEDGYKEEFTEQLVLQTERVLTGRPLATNPLTIFPTFVFGTIELQATQGRYQLFVEGSDDRHLRALHHTIAGNALLFTLAHEFAHLHLGHFDAPLAAIEVRRRMEIEADTFALNTLLSEPIREVLESDESDVIH